MCIALLVYDQYVLVLMVDWSCTSYSHAKFDTNKIKSRYINSVMVYSQCLYRGTNVYVGESLDYFNCIILITNRVMIIWMGKGWCLKIPIVTSKQGY